MSESERIDDYLTEWTGLSGGNACYCTGKCRTLGYCPANPPPRPFFKPRIRVKAWREPNEDGASSGIAAERWWAGYRKSARKLGGNWLRVEFE